MMRMYSDWPNWVYKPDLWCYVDYWFDDDTSPRDWVPAVLPAVPPPIRRERRESIAEMRERLWRDQGVLI
jgi:hypothetical protein